MGNVMANDRRLKRGIPDDKKVKELGHDFDG